MTLDSGVAVADLLTRTASHAIRYLDELDERRVGPLVSVSQLRAALARPIEPTGMDPERVIDSLVAAVEPGLLASSGGRLRLGHRRHPPRRACR